MENERIDFVPEDYTRARQSRRVNFLYIALAAVMFTVFAITFGTLTIRKNALDADELVIDQKMVVAQQAISQLESIQAKRQKMMQKAVLTSELIEPIPRSIILAILTNTMPDGLSLAGINLKQRNLSAEEKTRYKTKYEAIRAAISQDSADNPDVVNIIEISGYASNDIVVADYISNLSDSVLLDEVGLVQSKKYESKKNGQSYRAFKLSAFIRSNTKLTAADIDHISNYNVKSKTLTDRK